MLVVDRREIEFDRAALFWYLSILPREAKKLGLPAGPPTELRFDPREGVIDVVYGAEAVISIGPETLSAMLINYCLRTRIPLPRIADKIIRVEADRVVLSFKTWFDEPPVFFAKEDMRASEPARAWKLAEPGRATQEF